MLTIMLPQYLTNQRIVYKLITYPWANRPHLILKMLLLKPFGSMGCGHELLFLLA